MQPEGAAGEARAKMDWWDNRMKGLAVLSVLACIAWLVFILFYALYWSKGFTLFQNIIVTIVSFFITAGVIGILWMMWGMKYASPR